MPEYIEREAMLRWVHEFRPDDKGLASALINTPTADVAPVVHGRWVDNQGGFWEVSTCSICGEKCLTAGIMPNYCPNCGAKMDGGGDHE